MKCHNDCAVVECRYRTCFIISDGLKLVNVTVFGHPLDSFFGCSANDFNRFVQNVQLREEHLKTAVDDRYIYWQYVLVWF